MSDLDTQIWENRGEKAEHDYDVLVKKLELAVAEGARDGLAPWALQQALHALAIRIGKE